LAANTLVALLRGINVGGKHKLPMKELVALFEGAGCSDVRTYIQSGNVVFRTSEKSAAAVAKDVERRIEERFGYEVPVILRTAEALGTVASGNPFLADGADETHLHVGFLATRPTPEAVASLDPARSAIDSFRVVGTEVYLHTPGGMGRTKLTTDWFDRRLGATMTVRNWRTVGKLVDMARS
jgi:uncharacterized protein (DUF1697 family)